MTSTHGQLNPDWCEWLMRWPIGYTDIERDCGEWMDASNDPADLPTEHPDFIPRTTHRKKHRANRIFCIGNGQEPLCAAISFEEGLTMLGEMEASA